LPHFLARLDPASGLPQLAVKLRELLAAAGAPTTLSSLGVTREVLDAALATRPEIPVGIAHDAL
jgi:hypothetical protein